jgi:uncharacterized protein YcbX
LNAVTLAAGAHFPFDRLYAVEDGPSGFDPAAPGYISKQKFAVLAKIPAVAKVRTRYDEASGELEASFEGLPTILAQLDQEDGRNAFAAWLTRALGDDINGPLKVFPGPDAHRFTDDVQGFISVLNLTSVRDLSARIGVQVDPRRFRANFHVEGWPPWVENDATDERLTLGVAQARVVKPITRCIATHVDPESGERDIDLVPALYETYGHPWCGIYAEVTLGGRVILGDHAGLKPHGD